MFIDPYWEQFEPVADIWFYVVAMIYFLIGIASFVLNIFQLYFLIKYDFKLNNKMSKIFFVIFFFHLKYRIKKNIRKEGTLFIMNLAIADLMKIGIAAPMAVISNLKKKWVFGQFGMIILNITFDLFN